MDREPRVVRPNSEQILLEPVNLDARIPADHRVRLAWEFVEGLDLGPFYERIRSVEGSAGPPATDPAVLLTLWLYATIEGVGSARRLAKLCWVHDAYRWICGGVSVNAHTLSDFRSENSKDFEQLLTQSVAALIAEGGVKLRRVSQEGMRMRLSAAAASFRRGAEEQVETLREELEADPSGASRQELAAQRRAAESRRKRV